MMRAPRREGPPLHEAVFCFQALHWPRVPRLSGRAVLIVFAPVTMAAESWSPSRPGEPPSGEFTRGVLQSLIFLWCGAIAGCSGNDKGGAGIPLLPSSRLDAA